MSGVDTWPASQSRAWSCSASQEAWLSAAVIWQAKLKEMEAKLKSKEATMYEADGVAAKVARDRQGNFVFQFDKNRCASLL